MSLHPDGRTRQTVDFDGLTVCFDGRVLHPRAWTAEQSRWAARLLEDLPHGPVLELCAGAGQIGLAAVRRSQRRLVCVEADPVGQPRPLRVQGGVRRGDRVGLDADQTALRPAYGR